MASRTSLIAVLAACLVLEVSALFPATHKWCESENLGEECIPEGEEAWFDRVAVPFMEDLQHYAMRRNGGPMARAFHPKSHGCYSAMFRVVNPTYGAVGPLFLDRRFERLPAYVRFSNGHPFIQHDKERDMQGLAIKVVGVEGPKLRQRDALTQDFVLFDLPALPFADAVGFMGFVNNTVQKDRKENPHVEWGRGRGGRFTGPLSEAETMLKAVEREHGPAAAKLLQFGGIFDKSLRKKEFFSGTAYKFGDGKAVRWKAKPCDPDRLTRPEKRYRSQKDDPDFYRYDLNATLSQVRRKVCFKLFAQFQTSLRLHPIEKHSSIWFELTSPAVPLAEVTISARDFENPVRCEQLQFSPWNSAPEYQPLGSVNRLRRKVYQQSAHNRRALPEPVA